MKKNYFKKITFFKTNTYGFNNVKNYLNNHLTGLFILLFGLFGMMSAFGQSPSNFTSSGNWIAPVGVTTITVEAYGGGGAGGAGSYVGGQNGYGGGGGGGGAYRTSTYNVTPGNSYFITVGNGGIGGSGNGANGTASTATFDNGTITADFGRGGLSNPNGRTGGNGGVGDRNGGRGGDGSNGSGSGGGGGSAGTTGNGGNGGLTAGGAAGTGGTIAGSGANGTTANSANGSNGNVYGGGGSGGTRSSIGGNGASGFVRITFTCPPNVASAGTNQTLAACATTTTLMGSAVPSGMIGTWTVVSGTATITNPNSPTSGVTGLALPAGNVGTVSAVLRWTISNGACGSSSSDVTITTSRGPGCWAYCASNATSNDYSSITNVTFNTINNSTSNCVGYSNFTNISTTVIKTFNYNLTIRKANTCTGTTEFTGRFAAWIDWNNDGDFDDAGELVLSDAAASNGPITVNVTVPAGAVTGATRMRCRFSEGSTAPTQCGTYTWGETEDYTVNIIEPNPCVAPTVQPTALNLTPSGTSISGTFTPAVGADSYLVVISTFPTPSATVPTNGTNYPIGSSLSSGYIVIDNDSNTSFTAGGLANNTTYYFYIYAFNNLCVGGPLYLGTSPLSGNTTTTNVLPAYCSPTSTSSAVYISKVASVGTIVDNVNTPTGYSAGGYGNFSNITIATQVPGGGVNIEMVLAGTFGAPNPPTNSCPSTSQFVRTYVDWNKDGDFDDAGEMVFISGSEATPIATAIDNIFGFIIPPGTFPGNYRMRIRTRAFCDGGPITPCGSLPTGETEDYTLAVVEDCNAKITGVTNVTACGPVADVTLLATTNAGTEFRWYTTISGGGPFAVTPTGSLPITGLTTTTTYYVTAYDGVCETIHRTPIVATILPTTELTISPEDAQVCGDQNFVEINAAGNIVLETLLFQDFESGMAPFTVATPTNTNAGPDTPWSVKDSPYVPNGTTVWRPAVNSGAIGTVGNSFAFTTSDYQNSNIVTIMTSPVIDASQYLTLTLTFDHLYAAFSGDFGYLEVSTNGGGTWAAPIRTYSVTDIGTPALFASETVDFNAYAGQANLMFRFRYVAQWDDGWAIDNIKLEGTRLLDNNFTWTGDIGVFVDAALTTPYTTQEVSTIYVTPTGPQLGADSWSFTASANLSNGCIVSKVVNVNNATKTWNGVNGDDWFNPNNWTPVGVPTINSCIVIPDVATTSNNPSEISGVNNNAFGKNMLVKNNGVFELNSVNTLTIKEGIIVEPTGTFLIEDSSSLIQIDNVANIGNIRMQRNTNIRRLDYVYWSSPVANFASSAISPLTPTGFIYKWAPTTATSYASNFGNWVAGNETMALGRGYIVRGPDNFTTTKQIYTANFIGVPNNGIITTPISRSTYTGANYTGPTSTPVTADDDNWNLIGNPYPSAVNATTFLSTNTSKIAGFVKIWTHGTLPLSTTADPFYQDFVLNYTVNDYVTFNPLGPTEPTFDGFIPAGQGFFVLMSDGAATPNTVEFNNTMRSRLFRNDQFFRNENALTTNEKHRIWLQLISPQGTESKSLVGYTTEATNGIDHLYDAINVGVKTNFEIYSVADDQGLIIQGRALPFDANDRIQLGVTIPQNGNYTIAVATVDGLFESPSQGIYLEDRSLGITHDLRVAPYSFTATTGRFENRFVLKFNNETLGNEDFTANAVTVYTNESINISAPNQVIKSVRVHDLLGRVLGTFNNVNSNTFSSKNIAKTQSPLLVEVTLENGATKTFKVIF